ncbi:MAG: hypothetical protein HY231_11340 [Acidobacteria bacterium]|nr:hypothetical protein [Acidobacteriota bacterium]
MSETISAWFMFILNLAMIVYTLWGLALVKPLAMMRTASLGSYQTSFYGRLSYRRESGVLDFKLANRVHHKSRSAS